MATEPTRPPEAPEVEEGVVTLERLREVAPRALGDPGAFVSRIIDPEPELEHDPGLERLIDWQTRALIADLQSSQQDTGQRVDWSGRFLGELSARGVGDADLVHTPVVRAALEAACASMPDQQDTGPVVTEEMKLRAIQAVNTGVHHELRPPVLGNVVTVALEAALSSKPTPSVGDGSGVED